MQELHDSFKVYTHNGKNNLFQVPTINYYVAQHYAAQYARAFHEVKRQNK